MTNVTTKAKKSVLVQAAITAKAKRTSALNQYTENKTDTSRLTLANTSQRMNVAIDVAERGNKYFSTLITDKQRAEQLNANTTGCLYQLKETLKIAEWLDNPETAKAPPAAYLAVITQVKASYFIGQIEVRQNIHDKYTGKLIDKTPVRNCLRALYLLQLTVSDIDNAPSYINSLKDVGFKPTDAKQFAKIRKMAADQLAQNESKWNCA